MRTLVGLAVSAAVAAASVYAFSPRPYPEQVPTQVRADSMRINDLALAGNRLVAVGDLGSVFYSNDGGVSWQGAALDRPFDVALTDVYFRDAAQGWASGGDGRVLATRDGGLSWTTLRVEKDVSEPLMGVWASPDGTLFAYGSYGRFLVSSDGGKSWQPRDIGVEDFHVNAVEGNGDGRAMLVGEQGMALKTGDGGKSWQKLAPFYHGSLFGVAMLTADTWLAYGLRGNAYLTRDFGATWQKLSVPMPVSLFGHTRTADGRVLLVGQGGSVFELDAAGAGLRLLKRTGALALTGVAVAGGALVVAGEAGLKRIAKEDQ